MSPNLSHIWTLSARELRGWWLAVIVWKVRREEQGERDMLMKRARELGLKVK